MKILITFYDICDFGGIINNHEGLCEGLKRLGHEVTTVQLCWQDEVSSQRRKDYGIGELSATGIAYDQRYGWVWQRENRVPYKGRENLKKWKNYASQFDAIIWQIPVPSKKKSNRGNTDWIHLYDLDIPQVVYIHDGNFQKHYPWIYEIVDNLTAAVGVHPCAYHSLESLPIKRGMGFSAQVDIDSRISNTRWRSRIPGWLSLQTFKGWKRVSDLVRSVPYQKKVMGKALAGGGIEYYYMTSSNKMKPVYSCARSRDPDCPSSWEGRPIWEVAENHGMDYLGYITNEHRDAILGNVRCLIDPSWSHSYARIGDHFNRVVIDGIIRGAVPIARNLGVSTNEDGEGELFTPGINYTMIPWDATPKEFGEIVSNTCHMSVQDYRDMIEAGRSMLCHWECETVAQDFIDAIKGRPSGLYSRIGGKNTPGRYSATLSEKSDKVINEFFSSAF